MYKNQTKVSCLLVKDGVYFMAAGGSKVEGGFQGVMSTGQVGIMVIGQLAFAGNGTLLLDQENMSH